ncbi:MAG: hypothetical protein ACOH2H_26425 [Cypionkella sp.]
MSEPRLLVLAKEYTPVRLTGNTLKVDGQALDKPAAMRHIQSGKSVYSTQAQAKALSKAIGGGRMNGKGEYTIKEIHSGEKKGEIFFDHFHDPHRGEKGQDRGKGNEPLKPRKKMGHIYFGNGYGVS